MLYMMFTGSDRLSQTLRQQCAAELYVNAASYVERACLNVEPMSGASTSDSPLTASLDDKVRVVKDEARLVLNGGEPSLLQAAALATVIKRPIHSICLYQVSEQSKPQCNC